MKIKTFCCIFIVLFFSCKSVSNTHDPYENINIINSGKEFDSKISSGGSK